MNVCSCCGRNNAKMNSQYGDYLCYKHMGQFVRFGKVLDNNPRTCNDLNEIIIDGDISYIVLYNAQSEEIGRAIIDTKNIDLVKDKKWRINIKRNKPYAVTGSGAGNQVYLARLIMNCIQKELEVDHITGNTLDNRECNLRILSHNDNVLNTKSKCTNKFGVRGISYNKKHNTYVVDFCYKKDRYYLKPFRSLEEAIACRYYISSMINEYRYTGEDEIMLNAIDKLSEEQKHDIYNYVKKKVDEHQTNKVIQNENNSTS